LGYRSIAVVVWLTWDSLKLCAKLYFPDHRIVCLKMVLCSVQLVCIAFDYVCRSNYELRYARIFTGRNGNSVWEVDVMSSHGNFGNANLYTGI